MSSPAIVRALLVGAPSVTAIVAADRIMVGELPVGRPVPAILINLVSGNRWLPVEMGSAPFLHIDRVQVTPVLKLSGGNPSGLGYPGMGALFPLILAACANRRGVVGGFSLDSILPDIEGPGIEDQVASILSCSQDFIVKWTG